ncbi:DUF1592 domain-containing protein [Sandaracinus amylolyticus]|uniref:Cellulose-binding domain protein n=1 Tax=Sandaracinus amylolyticus TaxID=927083 RepID=A0A0F6SH19_9BACT|nr:DUF1592 domain-containing protein [Sandaracinus amylolyticus]AKF09674.1 Cellulose-binding domain protein [Sandaracinus amylolyticus]
MKLVQAIVIIGALAMASVGCVGNLGDGAAGPSGSGRPGGPNNPGNPNNPRPNEPVPACPDGDELGPRVVRRLTASELETTIRTVFSLDASAWSGPTTPPDAASGDGFTGDVDRLRVNETYASRLLETGRAVADVVSAQPRLSTMLPCATAGDEACARNFVTTYARRLYRRAPTDAELNRYLEAYRRIVPAAGFPAWVRAATIAMVQSPHVVWRSELGTVSGDGVAQLAGWEIATELAYTYTGAPPDDALLSRAERGELDDPAVVRDVARSMVLDDAGAVRPAFRRIALRFFEQWASLSSLPNITKDVELYPGFTPAVRDAMRRELDAYFDHVILEERGGVAELLTSPSTYVDATLASYYGFGAASGGDMIAAERPEGWGIGLLAQGGWLSVQANAEITSPTRRGHFIRDRLLCQEIPPPPPTVGPLPEVDVGSVSTRERYEVLHASNESCNSCHRLMDPIGFGFEHLDAAGRRRETEGRFEIDDSGRLTNVSAGDIEFEGAEAIAAHLAELPEVEGCIATWVARHAYAIDRHDAACMAASARPELEQDGGSFVDHWIALAGTAHFTSRR